jgi:hypothetical protein
MEVINAGAVAAAPAPASEPAAAPKDRRFLLARFGGMGDALFMTVVARWLSEHGYKVDFAVNEHGRPVLENNPHIDRLLEIRRMGPIGVLPGTTNPPHPVDLVCIDGAWMPLEAAYDAYRQTGELHPVAALNGRYTIENNAVHPQIWPTHGSDFVNTYDLHLGWAGIDPHGLTDEQKCPVYRCTDAELEWARTATANLPRPLYIVQVLASSPARTYLRMHSLIEAMKKATHGTVLAWDGNAWNYAGRPFPLPDAKTIHPVRASAALLTQADLLVCADTAFVHIGEALSECGQAPRLRTLAFFATVPAWTRSAYYRHVQSIDCVTPYGTMSACKCCIIGRDCPRRMAEAWGGLPDDQKEYLRFGATVDQNLRNGLGLHNLEPLPMMDRPPHEYFNTTPQGLNEGVQGAIYAFQARRQKEAYCTASMDLWAHVQPLMQAIEGER